MRLTEKAVAAMKPGLVRAVIWDDRLKGFGVRISPNGAKSFVAKTRVGRLQRMVTIGPVDNTLSVDDARKRAEAAIRAARDGVDPSAAKREARAAMTVAEICGEYMTAARAGTVTTRFDKPKAASTVAIDEGRVARHIVPLIGALPAAKLTGPDVQRMADAIAAGKTAGTFKTKARGKAVVRGGAGTATRVVELLGGIWTWSRKRGFVAGASPTSDVDRVRGDAKNRVLTEDELRALGMMLDDSPAATAIRLLAFTGCRRDEIVRLRWADIDPSGTCLHLEHTKTGRSTRPLAKVAHDVLTDWPRIERSPWVFPSRTGTGPADLKASIAVVFDGAGLTDARSHDLRRTFASTAADMEYSDATIGELLGHARRGVTERHYVRRSDPVLVAAATAVAGRIAVAMDGTGAEVVSLRSAG